MIKLKAVSKYYYNKGIITSGFNKIDVEFHMGEFVVITGESGSGKSTLLNVISGLDSYEEGEMYIDGKETSHYSERDYEKYRKKYISNIFQNFNLVNSYTVYQNIETILLLNGYNKKDIKERVLDLINKVDLKRHKNTRVSKLSGGQKQKVAIARALAQMGSIIIADEPTGNLDKKSAQSVLATLKEVSQDKLVIVVTHNYELFENYATRKITMFDGKIIEDKILKETTSTSKTEINNPNSISFLSKIKLGLRNTFNILPKFILLLLVFMFIFIALITESAAFKKDKYDSSLYGYNNYLKNLSKERIIITKNDKTPFNDNDYQKITNLKNIDYIVKNDLELDNELELSNNNFYQNCSFKDIKVLNDKLDYGTLPTKDDEVVLAASKNNYYLSYPDDILNKEYDYYVKYYKTNNNDKLKIVGIKYHEDKNGCIYYINNKLLEDLNNKIIGNITTNQLTINKNKINDIIISTSNNVLVGKSFITENLSTYFEEMNATGKKITINSKNLYFNNEIDLRVSKVLNKTNMLSLTNDDYEDYLSIVYLNPVDYQKLIPPDFYQSSVMVKDAKKIEETKKDLEELSLKALVVSDTLKNEDSNSLYVLNIISTIVTIVLIIVLFFISYLIIKIILKSRHIYFSTLRILGASKKVLKSILAIELFTILNISVIIITTLIILIMKDCIVLPEIKEILSFMKLKDYFIMYLIIFLMTYIITERFSAVLFKKSAINTLQGGAQ